jgi:hypothetical protein
VVTLLLSSGLNAVARAETLYLTGATKARGAKRDNISAALLLVEWEGRGDGDGEEGVIIERLRASNVEAASGAYGTSLLLPGRLPGLPNSNLTLHFIYFVIQ